eukprot:scaffold33514_cov35-Phaeocystis_antarctica.AAC.1
MATHLLARSAASLPRTYGLLVTIVPWPLWPRAQSGVVCDCWRALGTAKGCPWHAPGSPAALLGQRGVV